MTPIEIIQLSQYLAEARDSMLRAAKELRRHGGIGTNLRRRHADELTRAAETVETWRVEGEPRGYA